MCSPSPPDPPDYAGAAKEQGQANLEAAVATSILSNPNIISPYGSRTVSYDYGSQGNKPASPINVPIPSMFGMGGGSFQIPSAGQGGITNLGGVGIPRVTIEDKLSPVGQKQFNLENQLKTNLLGTGVKGLDRVSKQMASPFDMSQVQDYSTQPGVVDYNDPTVQAIIQRNQPQFDRQRSQTEADLLARGFNPGGEGYDARFEDIGKQENDMRLAALLAGGQEQSRVAEMESARRAQDIQEQAYLRNLPLSEVNALRTGNQPGMPQFQAYQGSQASPAPLFDATLAAGNFAQQNYQNQLAKSGGLFDLGGALLGAGGAANGFGNLFSFR